MAIKQQKKKSFQRGNLTRLRLSVFRSNANIFAQVIDDESGVTLAAASSLKLKGMPKVDAAREVGKALAKAALEKNLIKVFFDRGSFTYKGRVRALAEAAREQGLQF